MSFLSLINYNIFKDVYGKLSTWYNLLVNNVPQKIKNKWNSNTEPIYCLRRDEGDCQGRLTKEHAIIFKGRQLQEDWAILDICEYHHGVNRFQDGGKMNKEKHVWFALNRATDTELLAISKAENYIALRDRLNAKYNK